MYAGFWLRVVAAIIDGILLNIVGWIVIGLFFPSATTVIATSNAMMASSHYFGPGNLFMAAINWLYFTLSESSSWQATLGKRALSIKVTDMGGNRIGFGQANIRYWSKILSALILFIGFIMVAFTEKKQGLHDIIAKTLVVKK